MFLFLRLLLAHFVGDFVLQFDEVYAVKKKSLRGALVHYLIIFFTLLVFAQPYLRYYWTWMVILVAAITHAIQDEIKLRFNIAQRLSFFAFVLDQLIHVLMLAPILFFSFANQPVADISYLSEVYNNNALIILLIGYIISVFAGVYLLETFKNSYQKNPPSPTAFTVRYGMFERFIITTSAFGGYLYFLLLIPLLFRIALKDLKFSVDLAFNFLHAYALGLCLSRFPLVF